MHSKHINRFHLASVATALLALSLAGCGRDDDAPKAVPVPDAEPMMPAQAPPVRAPQPLPNNMPAQPAMAGVTVVDVDLGTAIGADQRIATAATTFKPTDTIYVSIGTAGASTGAQLTAKWMYNGTQQVSESSQNIAPNGPAATSFSISKPDGFPVGDYAVEISMDGTPTASRAFRIEG